MANMKTEKEINSKFKRQWNIISRGTKNPKVNRWITFSILRDFLKRFKNVSFTESNYFDNESGYS